MTLTAFERWMRRHHLLIKLATSPLGVALDVTMFGAVLGTQSRSKSFHATSLNEAVELIDAWMER